VVFGSEPAPLLVAHETTISRNTSDSDLQDMAQIIAAGMDPIGNHQGRPETKRHQAATLISRALSDLRHELNHV